MNLNEGVGYLILHVSIRGAQTLEPDRTLSQFPPDQSFPSELVISLLSPHAQAMGAPGQRGSMRDAFALSWWQWLETCLPG